jgi:hypothetical protein
MTPDDDYRDDDPDDYDDRLMPHQHDEADYEYQREQEEYAEHCDTVHGGEECTCPRDLLPESGPLDGSGYVYDDNPPF